MDSGSLKYIPEPPYENLLPAPAPQLPLSRLKTFVVTGALFILGVLGFLYHFFIAVPSGMKSDLVVSITQGQSLSDAANTLSTDRVIRSETAFKVLLVIFGGPRGVHAGDYYFENGENAIVVAWRLSHSLYDLKNIRVTIPEGTNSKEIADIIIKNKNFTQFNKADFIRLAAPYEGYLFPDTYFLLPNVTAQDVIDVMLATYKKRIQTISSDVTAFGKPITDVIKMASIVEEEARTPETRQIIAGILWKRLDQGMPLQVDSAFVFVNGKKDSRNISSADLAIDSPYNTYIHKGLPPTPISNPGLASINATLHPVKSPYYFYLSDAQGEMHYAVTLDEHVANKQKYLDF